MLICQITDLHIQLPGQLCYGVVDTEQALKDCIAAINALPQRPDVVLVTGDLVDFGRPDEYLHLATLLLSIEQPTYLIPGNHDDRDAMRRAFPQHVYLGREGTRATMCWTNIPCASSPSTRCSRAHREASLPTTVPCGSTRSWNVRRSGRRSS